MRVRTEFGSGGDDIGEADWEYVLVRVIGHTMPATPFEMKAALVNR